MNSNGTQKPHSLNLNRIKPTPNTAMRCLCWLYAKWWRFNNDFKHWDKDPHK